MFQKPTTKTFAAVAIEAGAFVAGAKVGDGLAAVMPDSVAGYKRYLIAGATILAAACVSPKTTMAQAAQNALIGAGAKQLYDELTEALSDAVPVSAGSSASSKFVNAVVGHTTDAAIAADTTQAGVGAWLGEPENLWDRPVELPAGEFTGV